MMNEPNVLEAKFIIILNLLFYFLVFLYAVDQDIITINAIELDSTFYAITHN